MRVGILETGCPPAALIGRYGRFADMFAALVGQVDKTVSFAAFSILDQQFPVAPTACDGWLVTGSPHGVYEELPWMLRLEAFLRTAIAGAIPVVGICFGHQLLAKALGGEVRKSERGWGLGIQNYAVVARPGWMNGFDQPTIRLNAIHQDQVVRAPAGATVIATSTFCPHAALAYGDSALSFQAHPEFTTAFETDLIQFRAGNGLPPDRTRRALAELATLAARTDAVTVAGWISRFLTRS